MTTTKAFKCARAGPKNVYWLKWSDEEHNRPHSTLTKGTGYGVSDGHSLKYISDKIKYIASYKKYNANKNKRFKINNNKDGLSFNYNKHSSITYATYHSAMTTTVSKQIFQELGKPSGMSFQYDQSPYLHFTLGNNNQYSYSAFQEIKECLDEQQMDLVVQNIDNECWCEVHALYDRIKNE